MSPETRNLLEHLFTLHARLCDATDLPHGLDREGEAEYQRTWTRLTRLGVRCEVELADRFDNGAQSSPGSRKLCAMLGMGERVQRPGPRFDMSDET